ncbi:MAG TPA: type II toxin-antitoxin system prevent-host-death family antitoxin [Phenylobacterium sp.]|jgi:prevent-host-death family protein|nr:type II toxin-antitoxin system prevent-host-death family antitoxin [Phenylobacterium sp.]
MTDIPLADAKARLSELVARAAAGDPVRITRRGRPVAELTAIRQDRKPLDVAALKRLTDTMPMASEGAADLVRRMRDEDRY